MANIRKKILKATDGFTRLPVLGLDISDLSIKYLKFSRRVPLLLDAVGEIQVSEGIIVNGEIKKEDSLVDTFNSWLAKGGRHLRSSYVAVSLPEEKSFLRLIQLPKIKKEEIGNAIRWEIEANIPLSPDELTYDYEVIEPLEGGSDHFDVVLTAFPKTIVESYVRVLKRCGFRPLTLELESQAIVRSTIADLRDKTARMIIDMGRTRTSLIMVAGGAIIFTTTIELGGRILEDHIMRAFGVDAAKAMELKKDVGLHRRKLEGKVFAALIPPLSALADELRKTVEYYRNHITHTHGASGDIGAIFIAGGDANLAGLDTYLSSSLRVPVYLADSFASTRDLLGYAIPPISKHQSLAFTTALGLAARGIAN